MTIVTSASIYLSRALASACIPVAAAVLFGCGAEVSELPRVDEPAPKAARDASGRGSHG